MCRQRGIKHRGQPGFSNLNEESQRADLWIQEQQRDSDYVRNTLWFDSFCLIKEMLMVLKASQGKKKQKSLVGPRLLVHELR